MQVASQDRNKSRVAAAEAGAARVVVVVVAVVVAVVVVVVVAAVVDIVSSNSSCCCSCTTCSFQLSMRCDESHLASNLEQVGLIGTRPYGRHSNACRHCPRKP